MTDVTVVICTHNRAAYLDKALEGLQGQSIPPSSFETIVVDNGSTDQTRQVVRDRIAAGFNDLQYIHEPTLGLSIARNTGWRAARRGIVAFLDDDAIPSVGWVERISTAFEQVVPRPGCLGGRIEPIWETPRPSWLPDELVGYLTVIDWSETPAVLDLTKQFIAGANMAFPSAVLREIGGFDPKLGRVGNRLVSGEEILVQRQLAARGYTIYYDPTVAVRHHVVASRLRRSWFYDRVFAEGVSEAVLRSRVGSFSKGQKALRAMASLLKLFATPRLAAGLILPASGPKAVARRCGALKRLGLVRGYLSA